MTERTTKRQMEGAVKLCGELAGLDLRIGHSISGYEIYVPGEHGSESPIRSGLKKSEVMDIAYSCQQIFWARERKGLK
jgi:hypothetical protein